MSRAQEIQEKLDLQAKLQLALSNKSSKVAAWLESSTDETKDRSKEIEDAKELEDSKNAFFNLPVVQIGSGLHFAYNETSKDDIHTIGEFINSDKKISSLSKKKKRNEPTDVRNDIYRIAKDDTKAMVALKRKMRHGQKMALRQDLAESVNKKTSVEPESRNTSNAKNDAHSSSDDEADMRNQKSTKKTFGLLFNGNKKRRK
ncbi:Nop19p NDAI_0B00890 [Naumovozyma dairenensis CBS 421]|uniref:Uncharacterized protein n=1 Tax=Naumovozyma dairenensis (strain ATCC 10597 / BCRC 20456 / CBS 421 / NBRC 0211 / NRRL Y-12639) TaxID=1071378 RepID=G0W5R2_NAUDC|nr:hypothetical protein NDAI_0B00890 [Naumovozyma dairenensis CBS 421]CCD23123.1 hypothetical protein NDAI_0B00890 [Naumovozyma dairenensis CBS 421]